MSECNIVSEGLLEFATAYRKREMLLYYLLTLDENGTNVKEMGITELR